MPRTPRSIAPPQAFVHSIRVGVDDIDALGHASNVRWVAWVNGVAEAHSRAVGLGPDRYRTLGLIWVVRRHEIDYLNEALEGDDLEALTWVDSFRGATCVRRTHFRKAGRDAPLARAATTWALLSAATGRPTRIPSELMTAYGVLDD